MKTMADRYIAKCKGCGCYTSAISEGYNARKTVAAPAIVYTNKMGFMVIQCRACGAERSAKLVLGTVNKAVVCNDKCMASHGTVCECSCGGKNHGGAHVAS